MGQPNTGRPTESSVVLVAPFSTDAPRSLPHFGDSKDTLQTHPEAAPGVKLFTFRSFKVSGTQENEIL